MSQGSSEANNEKAKKTITIKIDKKMVSAAVAVLLIIIIFYVGLSYVSYINAQKQYHAVYIINPSISTLDFMPHGIFTANVTVNTLSQVLCFLSANRTGIVFYVFNYQGYYNFTHIKPASALAGTLFNISSVSIDGNLHLEPGTYYFVIWNPNNYSLKVTITGYCEVEPVK